MLSDDSGREPTTIIVPDRERATGPFFGSSDGMDAISEDSERSEVSSVGVNSEDGFIGPALPEQEDREEEEEEENSDPELFPLDFQSVLEDLPVNLQDMSRHVGEDFLCLLPNLWHWCSSETKLVHLSELPPKKDWSRMVPDMLKYFDFDDKWLELATAYPTVSEEVKSTVDRGRLYVDNCPRLEKVYFLVSSDRRVVHVKSSCSSSYGKQKDKKQKAVLRFTVESTEIGAHCSCKNGRSAKCAHVSALFLRLRYLTAQKSEQKTTKRRRIVTRYDEWVNSEKR